MEEQLKLMLPLPESQEMVLQAEEDLEEALEEAEVATEVEEEDSRVVGLETTEVQVFN